jgi:hypothetical protein
VNGVLSTSYCFNEFQKSGAPGGTRTHDILLRRYALQNSKCCCWCRLQGNAPLISLLNWTEVGPKLLPEGISAKSSRAPSCRMDFEQRWAAAISFADCLWPTAGQFTGTSLCAQLSDRAGGLPPRNSSRSVREERMSGATRVQSPLHTHSSDSRSRAPGHRHRPVRASCRLGCLWTSSITRFQCVGSESSQLIPG